MDMIAISPETEIARLKAEIAHLRYSLQEANAGVSKRFIDYFTFYMENEPGTFSKEHDDEIEPFFFHLKMLTRDHVFHRLTSAAKELLPSDTAEAIKVVRDRIKSLQGRFDHLAGQIVDARRQHTPVRDNLGHDISDKKFTARFYDINEFVLRLLEIAETLEYLREITIMMQFDLGSTEHGLQATAYEIQIDIRRIIGEFITAAKSEDYVAIYDLAAYDMNGFLAKVDSIMATLAESV